MIVLKNTGMYNFYRNTKTLLLAILLIVAVHSTVWSQVLNSEYSVEDVNAGSSNLTSQLDIGGLIDPAYAGQPIRLERSELLVQLYFEGVFYEGLDDIPGQMFEFEVDFDIEIRDVAQNVVYSDSKTLMVRNLKPKSVYYKNITNLLSSYPGLTAHVTNISITDNSEVSFPTTIKTQLQSKLHLSLSSTTKFGVDVSSVNIQGLLTSGSSPVGNSVNTSKQVTFSWIPSVQSPNYEFQIMKLHNTNSLLASDPRAAFVAEIDWSTALTVEICSEIPELKLVIGDGSGYYLWRVRPIGNFYPGGIGDSRNWGTWNVSPTKGFGGRWENGNIISASNMSLDYDLFLFNDPDEDINYSYSRTFTEGNKTSETAIYANDLHQTIQSQFYIKSENSRVITQTVYDYSGRPALSSLPAPDGNTLDGYKQNWIQDDNGKLYSADDFDTETTIDDPGVMEGPTGDYYDGTTLDKGNYPVPDAEGFPFARTVFFNDGTGRVSEETGAGSTHKAGGKTTKTIYEGRVSDAELLRIFSDEAPKGYTVLKTMVTDPNGITTISYTNKEGQVIATCMSRSDEAPSALQMDDVFVTDGDVERQDDPLPASFEVQEEITYNSWDGSAFVSKKRLSISEETDIAISYEVNCSEFSGTCGNSSVECEYEVQFVVIDLQDPDCYLSLEPQTVDCSQTYNNPDWSLLSPFSCNWSLGSSNNILTLPPGNYVIEKRLTAKDDAYQDARNDLDIHNRLAAFYIKAMDILSDNITRDQDYEQNFIDAVNDLSDPSYIPCNDPLFTDLLTELDLSCSPSNDFADYNLSIDDNTNEITLTTPCCTTAVSYEPADYPYDCSADHTDWANFEFDESLSPNTSYDKEVTYQSGSYDFAGYLWDVMGAEMDVLQFSFSDVVNGYSENELNAMMYHMLNDEYYCGRLEYDNATSTWRKLDADDNDIGALQTTDIMVQYTCEDVWKCWQGAVQTYLEALEVVAGFTNLNASDNTDDNAGGTDTHDDHFDENIEGGFFVKWLARRALSKGIRDDAPDAEINISLLENFFTCAGYKFSGIVLRKLTTSGSTADITNYTIDYDPTATANVPTGYSTASASGGYWNSAWNGYFTQTVSATGERPVMITGQTSPVEHHQLRDKIFAFKHYEYWDFNLVYVFGGTPIGTTSQPNDDINNTPCEIAHCFYVNTNTPTPCEPVRCDYGYKSWDCTKRYEFFLCRNQLVSIFGPEDNTITNTCPPQNPDPNNPGESLEEMRLAKEDECKTGCEDREDEFRQALIGVLEARCYTIGGCEGDANNIPLVELESWVDAMVTQCQSQCDINTADCIQVNCTSSVTQTPFSYVQVIIGNPCENYLMYQAMFGSFELDVPSVCPNENPATQDMISTYNGYGSPQPVMQDQCDNTEAPEVPGNSAVVKIEN